MNSYTILVLAVSVGFDFVVPNEVLQQTIADNDLLLPESNNLNTNHNEMLPNNGEIEQKNIETNGSPDTTGVEDSPNEGAVEIHIEENIQNPTDLIDFQEDIDNQLGLQDFNNNNQFSFQEDMDTNFENEFELVKQGDYLYNDVVYKDPNEIMDTAAGFVPIPIFRKKQKQAPRRRYTTRRLYNRRPYASRRQYYFYPYYRYYRPSSLRYYYY